MDSRSSLLIFFRQYSWLLAGICLYFCVASVYVERGHPNTDEGFYEAVSHEVMQGRIPYHDFAYTQMPLLPYIQGSVMRVVGFGLRQQRWMNAVWGALAMLIGGLILQREGVRPLTRMGILLLWCASQPLMYYCTIGKTYAFAQLALLAAASCLFFKTTPGFRIALFSLAGVLAVGARLTMSPAVAILWIGLAQQLRPHFSWGILISIPLLMALILLGPFYIIDPERAIYWTWLYHLESKIPKQRFFMLFHSFTMVPGIVLMIVPAGLSLYKKTELVLSPAAWWLYAGTGGWISSVLIPGIYADYAIPCIAVTLIGAGLLLDQGKRFSRLGVGLLFLGFIVAAGLSTFWFKEKLIFPGYLHAVDDVAGYVRTHSKPGDVVLSPAPEIPLQSGREYLPGLEMGSFGVTAEMNPDESNRKHMITFEQLKAIIDSHQVSTIVFSTWRRFNFSWSSPSLRPLTAAFSHQLTDVINTRYEVVYHNDFFIVFKPVTEQANFKK